MTDPFELFDAVVRERRFTANEWHTIKDGRHYLCLAAAYGEPGTVNSAQDCPVDAFPEWLKELMPNLDDGIAEEHRFWLFEGFAARNRAMAKLDGDAWDRIRTGFMIGSFRQAIASATPVQPKPEPEYWRQVVGACEGVITALESGDAEKLRAAEAAEAARALSAPRPLQLAQERAESA